MQCADPVLCYTDESTGKRLFRNFSIAPYILRYHMPHKVFSCGKCIYCRKRRAYELAARCVLHSSLHKDNCFLTLTYDEKREGYNNTFQYRDIQLFKKKLRQYCKRAFDKRVQIFNVHEYGKNGKKHWHLIVFNHDFEDKKVHTTKNSIPLFVSDKLQELWPYGFSTIGDVSEASAMYQAQYMEKDFKNNNVTSNKKSHSKHSGIGKPYFLKHYKQLLELGYVPFNGTKLPLPRYFEKLAHKHYSHYYEPENFKDTPQRKALHRPFKHGESNKLIADCYKNYKILKETKIIELESLWKEFIEQHKLTQDIPDFKESELNYLYDLNNKQTKQIF